MNEPSHARRLWILDPGFESLAGHHYELNRAIVNDCRKRGVCVRIAAHKAIHGEAATLPVERVFSHSIYDEVREGGQIEPIRRQCIEDLGALTRWRLRRGDVVLLHSTTRAHFLAIGEWIAALQRDECPRCVILHTVGWFGGEWTKGRYAWSSGFRRAAERLADAGAGVTFAAVNRPLCDDWEAHTGQPAQLHPIPSPVVAAPQSPLDATAALRFAFLGGARPEKGFELLPGIAALLLRGAANCRIVVQVAEVEATWAESVKRLAAMAGDTPALQLHRGCARSADYERLLAAADVLLLPYDPLRYQVRGSGIFFEAMASGRPMVLPAYTWMAGEWRRFDAGGALFSEWSADAVAEAACRVARSYGEQRARSVAAAERWNAKHSVAAFVDFVLGGS